MAQLKTSAPLWTLCVLVFSFLAQTAFAVFQDEAYSIDYAHTLVGTPIRRNTFFHAPNTGSRATLLYTLSEQNVIGAINPRDGELVWRVLANDTIRPTGQEGTHGILRAHPTSTTIVSAIGNTVRAWDAKDGRMVWEWSAEWPVKSLEVLGLEGTHGDVVVLTEGEITGGDYWRLSGLDGSIKWNTKLNANEYPLGISASASKLFCTALRINPRGGYQIKIQTVDPTTGKGLSQNLLDTGEDVASEDSIVHLSGTSPAPIVAWKDEKVKNLKFNVLGTKQKAIAILNPYGTSRTEEFLIHEPTDTNADPYFLLQFDQPDGHRGEVWHVDDVEVGKITRSYSLDRVAGHGAFSVGNSEKDVYFTRHTELENILYASTSATALETWSFGPDSSQPPFNAKALFSVSELAPRSGSHFSIREAFVNTEGDWMLLQNGGLTWGRYEGLTGIAAAAFVDVPSQDNPAEALAAETESNPVSAYIQRVQRHIVDLQHLPNWLAKLPSRLFSSFTGLEIGETSPLTDKEGFASNKVLIIATKKGRVAALSPSSWGQVLWTMQVADLDEGETWNVRSIESDTTGARILGMFGEFVLLDPVHGRIIQREEPRPEAGVLHYVNVKSASASSALLGINFDNAPGHIPAGVPESAVIVTQRTNDVVGWKPSQDGKTTLAWSFKPQDGETITSLTTRPAHDPVASIGRALGDRNVLYKYLSNNLVLLSATNKVASSLSVYLLDTVSGQLLYSTKHNSVDVSVDIPIVFSENWFAYSLFSSAPADTPAGSSSPTLDVQGHQLIVSELFESENANDRGPLALAHNQSSLTDPYSPDVKSAAYVITSPITALATTSTMQGITPRSLLAYTPALAALLAIPVPFLSPRRPVDRDPTPAEREEGLPRYQPHLDFAPTWFLSHKREVLGIEKIVSTPTQMESTSLVFAYGDLDIFGIRVSPIGAFDVLGKGFGKIQLVLTCVALAIGTGLLGPMAKRKQIDGLWRS